jgi:hypothetical protein
MPADALAAEPAKLEAPAPAAEAAPVAAAAAEAAPAEEIAPAPKTASGKARSISGKGPAAKTTSSRRAPVSAAPASLPRTGREIWIICRECLEEWTVDPDRAKSQETIVCPVCEHRAQSPSDDILHQIALYKGIERQNATLALAALAVGVFAMFLWTLLTANPARAEEPVVFYAPIAIGVISFIATLIFTHKYENSKWETYF